MHFLGFRSFSLNRLAQDILHKEVIWKRACQAHWWWQANDLVYLRLATPFESLDFLTAFVLPSCSCLFHASMLIIHVRTLYQRQFVLLHLIAHRFKYGFAARVEVQEHQNYTPATAWITSSDAQKTHQPHLDCKRVLSPTKPIHHSSNPRISALLQS